MPEAIISKKTRYEFREFLTGITLREIEMQFDAANIHCDEECEPSVSGQRRARVEQYYHSIDFSSWRDVQKILIVFRNIMVELNEHANEHWDKSIREISHHHLASLSKWLRIDGFEFSNGAIARIGHSLNLNDVTALATKFDAGELHRQIDRINNSIEDDPALAIGTAKELLETTCKTILEARDVVPDPTWDVPGLVKHTRKSLLLLPEDVPESAKGSDVIRRLLSNLGSVAQGLSELRNLYGTGHGAAGNARRLGARHARLAVGAATTLALFLFETHEQQPVKAQVAPK